MGFPQPHAMTEYLVLQQRLMNGLQEPWCVWGHAEETGLEVVERWEKGLGGGDVDEGGNGSRAGTGTTGVGKLGA